MKSDLGASTSLPLLPVLDVLVFPHMVRPLFVGREKSIRALEAAMSTDKRILLVAQRSATEDDPALKEIYSVGTIANVLQLLKLPDGTVKVLVEGTERALIESVASSTAYLRVNVRTVGDRPSRGSESEALVRTCMKLFEQYVNLGKKVPAEVLSALSGIDEPGRLADTIAAHMALDLAQKQKILEVTGTVERIEHLMALMEGEI